MSTCTDSTDDKKDLNEKRGAVKVSENEVDTGAALVYGEHGELDPAEALRVRKKIDYHILPLMFMPYGIQYMGLLYDNAAKDKQTLASSAILGIREATHLTTNQYNWLGTIFFFGYLVSQFPQNFALQHFPVAKWMSINIFLWSVALCFHAACTSFRGLFTVRLILGMFEGYALVIHDSVALFTDLLRSSIIAGFMIISSMYYTRKEQTLRIGYWFLMSGTAQIISSFISFGTLHIKTSGFEPWQWLMIITGILTFIISLLFWFLFPDSPTNAWFLTPEERAVAVMRLMENQTGVESKRFKKGQMMEAIMDPKTWLFALFTALGNRQIIVSSFGFTALQTTLLGCVDGVIEIVTIWTGVTIAAKLNSRAWVAFIYFIPNILATILVNVLPWSNKVGLLFSVWLAGVGIPGFTISLAWVSSVTAGHTKRVTTNAIVLGAYVLHRQRRWSLYVAGTSFLFFLFPQLTSAQTQYKPHNHVPWTVIGICYACCMVLVLAIRFLLIAENKRRDAEPTRDGGYDDVYVERPAGGGSGRMEKVKVDKEFLDLTDRQNRDFRYVY
ncbi:MFS general substrate transporter [Mycena leptocephala]|nr:MFS general substrate transporter [Mycena leptocephala]